MITIILVEPQTSGNVGAIARVMKNFGANKLVLVNPKCNHLDEDALRRAMGGKSILKSAKVVKALPNNFSPLVATTARIGHDENIARSPIFPQQLAELKGKANMALVFGREDSGLATDEIRKCDITVTIPASSYKVLNISHAVAILLYELHKNKAKAIHPLATAKERNILLGLIDSVLDRIKFSTKEKRETQRRVWKRVLGKAMLTKKEAFSLMGFFRKI